MLPSSGRSGVDVLCSRKPARTTSAVRSCLILSMVRAFSRYGASSGLATTPSRPAPSNCSNHDCASAGSVVVRVRWHGPSSDAEGLLEGSAALGERPLDVGLVAEREQVEGDETGGRLLRQLLDPRRGRVDPLLQRLELQLGPGRHEQLAVEHHPLGQLSADCLDDLGEVAGQRFRVAAGELDLVAVAEHQAPKPVPLRLEAEARRLRDTPATDLASIGRTGGMTGRSTCRG